MSNWHLSVPCRVSTWDLLEQHSTRRLSRAWTSPISWLLQGHWIQCFQLNSITRRSRVTFPQLSFFLLPNSSLFFICSLFLCLEHLKLDSVLFLIKSAKRHIRRRRAWHAYWGSWFHGHGFLACNRCCFIYEWRIRKCSSSGEQQNQVFTLRSSAFSCESFEFVVCSLAYRSKVARAIFSQWSVRPIWKMLHGYATDMQASGLHCLFCQILQNYVAWSNCFKWVFLWSSFKNVTNSIMIVLQ